MDLCKLNMSFNDFLSVEKNYNLNTREDVLLISDRVKAKELIDFLDFVRDKFEILKTYLFSIEREITFNTKKISLFIEIYPLVMHLNKFFNWSDKQNKEFDLLSRYLPAIFLKNNLYDVDMITSIYNSMVALKEYSFNIELSEFSFDNLRWLIKTYIDYLMSFNDLLDLSSEIIKNGDLLLLDMFVFMIKRSFRDDKDEILEFLTSEKVSLSK